MTLSRLADLVTDAAARVRAVPAFNVITLEHAEAIILGATDSAVPVILQVSQNALAFRQGVAPLFAACRELAAEATIPVAVHADHIDREHLALLIIGHANEWGVGSLMFDAAALPYDENTGLTARVSREAHAAGLWIEGELGEVGGKDGAHAPGVRTDPTEAVKYVEATAVDALAVAVGSSHAMRERVAALDLDLIALLADAVNVPLVLHGSSGVPDGMLADAVAAGIRKVNIGTALNTVGTATLRSELARQPDAIDPRRYLAGMRDAIRDEVSRLAALVG